jgi:hypothetical protein
VSGVKEWVMANGNGAAWNKQNVVGLVAALAIGSGGTFGASRVVGPHANCVTHAEFDGKFSERLKVEAPWHRVEGQVMGAVTKVTSLERDLGDIQNKQYEMDAKLDILLSQAGFAQAN